MTPTNGMPPEGKGPWMVQFRSGVVSGPFTRGQIRWSDTGWAFDVVAVEQVREGTPVATWNAKSGGY